MIQLNLIKNLLLIKNPLSYIKLKHILSVYLKPAILKNNYIFPLVITEERKIMY